MKRIVAAAALGALALVMAGVPANASNSWGGYHWARTANPFSLQLGDNVTSAWDPYLAEASADWTASSVLDTSVVAGTAGKNVKRCAAPQGRVEVCNAKYGFNGWLGIAGITVSGGHITSGYVKLNDSYFGTSTYNKPEWRRLVTCQEVGHTLGLDHQDEQFDNPNLGTCQDYTSNPLGPPSNEHPDQHDFDQLEAIYAHLDSSSSVSQSAPSGNGRQSRSRVENVDEHGNGTVTWIFHVN